MPCRSGAVMSQPGGECGVVPLFNVVRVA
jgi:hypothetical protein